MARPAGVLSDPAPALPDASKVRRGTLIAAGFANSTVKIGAPRGSNQCMLPDCEKPCDFTWVADGLVAGGGLGTESRRLR
jgi:hypothetical protein